MDFSLRFSAWASPSLNNQRNNGCCSANFFFFFYWVTPSQKDQRATHVSHSLIFSFFVRPRKLCFFISLIGRPPVVVAQVFSCFDREAKQHKNLPFSLFVFFLLIVGLHPYRKISKNCRRPVLFHGRFCSFFFVSFCFALVARQLTIAECQHFYFACLNCFVGPAIFRGFFF